MGKRILSLFCVLALCLTMLPATALAADAPVPYLGWNVETNTHEMASCDSYTVVTAETTEWNTGWYVVNSADPLWISERIEVNGDVSLILMDGAVLDSQGIHVGPTDSLTIYGQSAGTGRLTAMPGTGAAGQAVIGGNAGEAGGTIAIHGGNIDAQSDKQGMDVDGVGAGIGGGANGAGGIITITGGIIRATGGQADTMEGWMIGAPIGGGSGGDSGTITITGGQIEVRSNGPEVAGIGAGSGGTNGTINITGGYFYEGDLMQNTVSGVQVAEGLSVILQDIDNQVWYKVTDQVGELTISGGTEGTDYTWENGVITILTSTPLTISGNGMACKERIVVGNSVSAQLTISNVNIFTVSSPLEIPAGSSLSLTLTGENTLKTSEGSGISNRGSVTITGSGALDTQAFSRYGAGIDSTDAELVIEDGKITAVGGGEGAGIGGGAITIHGGTVTATGYHHSAGIGGSAIVIDGGIVEATGGGWGAGISGAAGSSVKISGGEVTAQGGTNSGAGIGGFGGSAYIGHAESGGIIEITGGNVNATATRGAGIGGGGHTRSDSTQWGDGGTITISGGVVTASSQYAAAIGGGSHSYPVDQKPGGGAGGDITISGGTVTATSGRDGVGIGGGSAAALSGSFSTGENGNAVIITTAVSDQSGTDTWNGIFFEGNNDGQVYGSQVTPQEDFTIPQDKNLVIGSDQTLTISDGVVVTNDGTITAAEGSSLINDGVLVNNGTTPDTMTGTGTTIKQDGATVTIQQGGNTVTVTLPESSSAITPNGNGSVTLPSGSTVETGNGPAITVSDENTTVTPAGEVSIPGGGSVTVTDDTGNQTTVTVPENGGTIVPNENGSVTLPGGATVETGNGPAITVSGENTTVTPSGEVSIPGGGSVTVDDGNGNTTTVTVPENGGTIVPNESGSITLPGGSSVTVPDGAGGTTTVTVPETGGTLDPSTGTVLRNYTVTFDSKGGSSVDSIVVAENSLVTKPTDPTRDGYTFTGWYQDAACINAWDFATTQVTADITLYAGWKQDGSTGGGTGGSTGGSTGGDTGGTEVPEVPEEQLVPFTDIDESDYYYDAVQWAASNGVTSGTSATIFSPDMTVSRAQMVTFLWRANGSPAATGTNPFTDVDTGDYYYDAVLWAVENGVTNGTSATTFSPDASVSRAQAVTFQWRAAGSPGASGNGFGDVAADAYYVNAVTWAVANGITNGTGDNMFSPDVVVSRAQAVTFLYRAQV